MISYINKTDFLTFITFVFFSTMFLVNILFSSDILLYVVTIAVYAVLIYTSVRHDPSEKLRQSVIVGSIGGFFYSFVNRLFVESQMISYLKGNSLNIYGTPLSILLSLMYLVVVLLYLYQRLRAIFSRKYVASLLTGAISLVISFVFNYVGDKSRLWSWNALVPDIPLVLNTPLFVPLSFFLTFFLSPYILGIGSISGRVEGDSFWLRYIKAANNPIIGGVRCSIILSASLLFMFYVFVGIISRIPKTH